MQSAERSSTQLQNGVPNEGSGRDGPELKIRWSRHASASGRQASRSVVVQCSQVGVATVHVGMRTRRACPCSAASPEHSNIWVVTYSSSKVKLCCLPEP